MPSVWIETRPTPKGERYRVVWRDVVFDADGRPLNGPRRKLPQVSDAVRAEKQKLAKISELEDIEAGLKPKARLRTWGEIARLYKDHAQMRIPASYDHLTKPAVDTFTAFYGESSLADNIDGTVLIAYEKRLRQLEPKNKPGEVYKPNTIRRLLKDLRTCLRFAYKQGWMREPPKISLPEAQDSERLPTPEEVARIHADLAEPYKLAVHTLACTGLRLGEFERLDGGQFYWNAGENHWDMKVRILKRKESDPTKIKVVPIQAPLAKALGLPRQPGRIYPFHGDALEKAMARACEKLGIELVTPHDLRHYWATHYMIETGDLYGLMRTGGWKDLKSVMKYQHLTKGRSKAILGIEFLKAGPTEPPRAATSPSTDAVLRS